MNPSKSKKHLWTNLSPLALMLFCLSFSFLPKAKSQDFSTKEKEAVIMAELNNEIILLEAYLKYISNKKIDFKSRTNQIPMVLSKFDASAKIQVSSLYNKEVKNKAAEKYFYHLRDLKYDDVEIDFKKTAVGNLIKIDQNTYQADGFYLQVFIGKESDKIKYADQTKKSIQFEVKEIKRNDGTTAIKIKFLNINVLSTEELNFKD